MRVRELCIILCVLVLLVASPLLGCAGKEATPAPTATPAPELPKTLYFTGTPAGSTGFLMAAAICDLISKNTPMKATAAPTSGAGEGMVLMVKGQSEMAFVTTMEAYDSYLGLSAYKGLGGITRYMFPGYFSAWHIIVLKKSGIRSFADLRGKTVMARAPASPPSEAAWQALIKSYGMTEKDINIVLKPSHSEAMTALREGLVDCVMMYSATPSSTVVEVDSRTPVSLVQVDMDKAKAISKENPFLGVMTVPAGTYSGMDADVVALSVIVTFLARADVSDEGVYEATKTVYKHIDALKQALPAAFKETTVKNALSIMPAPFHAGAIRYYQEVGAWTPELEKANQELLAKMGQKK